MKETNAQVKRLAEQVRQACLDAAQSGFQEASISGLCHDGAIEAALGAIQSLDIDRLVKEAEV